MLFCRAAYYRLDRFGQPREKVLELSARISSAAVFIGVAGLLLPPVGGMFPNNRLMTFINLATVGYVVYLASVIWKLYQPFASHVPAAGTEEAPEEPPVTPLEPAAVPARRCGKCGQRIDDSMKVCAFCKQPIP